MIKCTIDAHVNLHIALLQSRSERPSVVSIHPYRALQASQHRVVIPKLLKSVIEPKSD